MSHYLIELYSPNAQWLALTSTQRQQFLAGIQGAMATLSQLGVEVVTLSETDGGVDHTAGYRFLGIWRFEDTHSRDLLLAGIKASGWYDYFEHVNAAGSTTSFENHVQALCDL